MSRTMNWLAACGLGIAALGSGMGMSPGKAAADDTRLNVTPAVQRSTDGQSSLNVQPVRWRAYVGPGGFGVYRGGRWGYRGYVGPRYYGGYYGPRYFAPRYYARPYYGGYGAYYGGYPAYGYGYSYPAYGYGTYGYAW